ERAAGPRLENEGQQQSRSNGRTLQPRLFPKRLDDRVVVAEDQVEPVRIVRNAPNAARRADPPQHLGQIFLANDARLAGLRLAFFDKFLADAVLAAVDGDRHLVAAGKLLDGDGILRGAHAHPLELVLWVEGEDGADRDKALRLLRLRRYCRDELQVEDVVQWLS